MDSSFDDGLAKFLQRLNVFQTATLIDGFAQVNHHEHGVCQIMTGEVKNHKDQHEHSGETKRRVLAART